jgi:hypothetical protein
MKDMKKGHPRKSQFRYVQALKELDNYTLYHAAHH